MVQKDSIRVKFVTNWEKYYPVILEYGRTTFNKTVRDFLDKVDLTQKSMHLLLLTMLLVHSVCV